MHLIEITDQKTWSAFIGAQRFASFQQSWAWGEFQASQGRAVRRFFFQDEAGQTVGAIQLIHYKRRLSGYWFAPRGPVFSNNASTAVKEQFQQCITELLKQTLGNSALFYRVEPNVSALKGEGMMPKNFRRTHAMSPAATEILNLDQTEEVLLEKMHTKTRYNIRVAEKHGIKVYESNDMEAFLKLTQETAERDAFVPHAEKYMRALYSFLAPLGMARLRFAEKDGQVLAANMEILFGDTLTYLHGSSSSTNRQFMAPFALHWEAIKQAKADGFHLYDFWGCNPESKENFYYKPTWEGISRFKKGWGGMHVEFVGTWDLPMNNLIYKLAFLGR